MEKLFRGFAFDRTDSITEPPQGFHTLMGALHQRNVRYVLIEGLAMRVHGSAHLTDDLDLCYARDARNLAALAEAMAPLHPRLRGAPEGLPFVLDARTLRGGANFALETTAGAVDLFGDVAGTESFAALWESTTEMELFGVPVRVASIDDLIAMKRAAGRTKDQPHLLELERLRQLHSQNDPSKTRKE